MNVKGRALAQGWESHTELTESLQLFKGSVARNFCLRMDTYIYMDAKGGERGFARGLEESYRAHRELRAF